MLIFYLTSAFSRYKHLKKKKRLFRDSSLLFGLTTVRHYILDHSTYFLTLGIFYLIPAFSIYKRLKKTVLAGSRFRGQIVYFLNYSQLWQEKKWAKTTTVMYESFVIAKRNSTSFTFLSFFKYWRGSSVLFNI